MLLTLKWPHIIGLGKCIFLRECQFVKLILMKISLDVIYI